MLDFNAPEFLVVAIVALLVIGPKDLPKMLRVVGNWVGRARGVARQFRSGLDTMIRESELAEKVLAEAANRFSFPPSPAFAFGVSQGGAIALQTVARSPGTWRGVASVATFRSLDRPVLRSAEELIPESLHSCCPLAALCVSCGTKLRAGYWPADVRPVDAAAKLHLPVFIAHGDRDAYMDIDQAREIFAAVPSSRKQFRVVAGGDHSRVLSIGSTALYADLCQFFLEALQPEVTATERGE